MVKLSDLERQLREWREARRREDGGRPRTAGQQRVRVKGREITIVRRVKRPVA